jgi:hypothetical protein
MFIHSLIVLFVARVENYNTLWCQCNNNENAYIFDLLLVDCSKLLCIQVIVNLMNVVI